MGFREHYEKSQLNDKLIDLNNTEKDGVTELKKAGLGENQSTKWKHGLPPKNKQLAQLERVISDTIDSLIRDEELSKKGAINVIGLYIKNILKNYK